MARAHPSGTPTRRKRTEAVHIGHIARLLHELGVHALVEHEVHQADVRAIGVELEQPARDGRGYGADFVARHLGNAQQRELDIHRASLAKREVRGGEHVASARPCVRRKARVSARATHAAFQLICSRGAAARTRTWLYEQGIPELLGRERLFKRSAQRLRREGHQETHSGTLRLQPRPLADGLRQLGLRRLSQHVDVPPFTRAHAAPCSDCIVHVDVCLTCAVRVQCAAARRLPVLHRCTHTR